MELRIDPASDQAILSALRSGQVREAARLMVQTHGVAVFQVCLAMTGELELAEDLTQASFARAFALLRGFGGEMTIRQWLEGIARRCCAEQSPDAPGEVAPDGALVVSESLRRRLEVLAAAM
jgi:DNA-directed RNA polymerase specialized sigma24 family protein